MKKTLFYILTAILTLSVIFLAGCSKKDEEETGQILYIEDADLTEYVTLPNYENLTVDITTEEFKNYISYTKFDNLSDLDIEIESEGLDEGTVQLLDTAIIEYVGKKDGVAFEGGSASDYDLVIGSGTFIDDFEEGLIGVDVGETVDLNLTFPENYSSEELAGAEVVFTVTVKGIMRPDVPEITDDIAANLGYDSLSDYENALTNSYISDTAWTEFMEGVVITETPQYEVDRYCNNYIEYIKTTAESQGTTFEDYIYSNMGFDDEASLVKALLPSAESYTKIKMACYLYAQKENIEVTEEEINDYITENAGSLYGDEESIYHQVKDSLVISAVNSDIIANVEIIK